MYSLQLCPVRKRSESFSNSRLNSGTIRLNELINQYKDKLRINEVSTSTPVVAKNVHCTLQQAKKIQNLNKMLRRKKSDCHRLLSAFETNRDEPIEQFHSQMLPSAQKIRLFREGVNYRSRERSRGSGVNPINKQSLLDYMKSEALEREEDMTEEPPRISDHMRLTKTSQSRRTRQSFRVRPQTRM